MAVLTTIRIASGRRSGSGVVPLMGTTASASAAPADIESDGFTWSYPTTYGDSQNCKVDPIVSDWSLLHQKARMPYEQSCRELVGARRSITISSRTHIVEPVWNAVHHQESMIECLASTLNVSAVKGNDDIREHPR